MGKCISTLNGTAKRTFTTSEAAEICRLPHQMIIQCLDNGKLRGSPNGGAGLGCIPRKELERFMKLCGYR